MPGTKYPAMIRNRSVTMKYSNFYLSLALLFTRELDAVSNHARRVMPIPGALSDSAGQFAIVGVDQWRRTERFDHLVDADAREKS